jgi:outer membrane lipoprotein-sorting protein
MAVEIRNSCLRSRRRALHAFALAAALPLAARGQTLVPEDDPVAKGIVEKADQIRFPAESFEVDVDVTNLTDGQVTERRRYKILSKGNENTIVQVIEPAADRGQVMLMRGRDLWIYLPNISQPVRLSLSQRLTGQVANGDLARANFAGDYRPRLLGTEKLDGADCHRLELVAADRGVTYARVLYWVRQANSHPVKAEFYSVSERLLKTCRYEGFRTLGGRVRPTRLVLQDALRQGDESVLDYSDLKLRDLPDRMFTKEYLRRL